jgi:hypothetical protein
VEVQDIPVLRLVFLGTSVRLTTITIRNASLYKRRLGMYDSSIELIHYFHL